MLLRLVSFLLVAGLSFSEKIQTWDKRNTREKDIISTGCFKTPKSTIFVVPKHLHVPPRTQPLNTSHGSQLSPRLTHSPSQLSEQNFTHQPTKWQHLPLNEPQNGGCPLGRSLIYEDTAQRAQTCYWNALFPRQYARGVNSLVNQIHHSPADWISGLNLRSSPSPGTFFRLLPWGAP